MRFHLVFVMSLFVLAGVLRGQTVPSAEKSVDSEPGTKAANVGLAQADVTRSGSREQAPALIAEAGLPDAPGESSSAPTAPGAAPFGAKSSPAPPVAPLYEKYIEPGQTVQPLASADKVLFGFHQLMSPYLLLTIATAAGYEQAVNGSPNYGTNFGAYGQRVGAGAIRDGSQAIFSDSIMAPILHEDPRYYVMGNRRNAAVRAAYAISRVFVTRSDDGAPTPNYSLLSGYAGAAALENAYYPGDNRGFSETTKSFAGSLGGAAVSNIVREFIPNLPRALGLK